MEHQFQGTPAILQCVGDAAMALTQHHLRGGVGEGAEAEVAAASLSGSSRVSGTCTHTHTCGFAESRDMTFAAYLTSHYGQVCIAVCKNTVPS